MTEWERLIADLGDAQPAYCTRPTEGAPHALKQAVAVSAALGTPLIPWQRLAARIITERRIDDPRRYRWPIVIFSTPRQVGKTTTYRVLQTLKCITQPRREAFYTAQTGKDARARWKDIVTGLTADTSPFRDRVTVKLGAGDSEIKFWNGSTIAPFAPTPESLHGYSPHDVGVDEGFAFDDAQGDELMGAIIPAQQNIRDRQLIIFSTAGNAESTWLRRQIERGRELASDPGAGIAYLEWSMPEGADPWNPDTWKFHPGLNHLFDLEDMQALAAANSDSPQTWLRAFMNTWVEESDTPPIITPEELAKVTSIPQTPPADGLRNVAIAYEAAYDRSYSVIVTAWIDPKTGQPALRVGERTSGSLEAAVLAQYAKRPRTVGADDGGPTRDTTDQLRAAGREPEILGAKDFATACDAFVSRVKAGTVSIHSDPYLDQELRDAVTRSMSQGWALDRRKSRGPIPTLIAMIVALRLIEQAPAPAPAPKVWIPSHA